MNHVLIARQDNLGDVLLAGPCVRAVAATASQVSLLTGPHGRAAGELLPGVDDLMTWCAPWIDPRPPAVGKAGIEAFVDEIRERAPDQALILTSFHQSPLPLALLLRQAGVPWVGAISDDYPGSLLDLRHRVDGDPPEALRMLSLAEAAGYRLQADDHGGLALRRPLPSTTRLTDGGPYVVVHPGASVPARRPSAEWSRRLTQALARRHRVVVTGSRPERDLTRLVAGSWAIDLGGRTTLAELASVLTGALVVVAPNTGAAHLAAAAGTPVVSLFAPVVPAARWAPYGVPAALLGDQHAPCRGSRAPICPVRGHPCLNRIDPGEVCRAVTELAEPQAVA
ncbi:MAG TPA: glycosyltransferase family 9 protein [Amycolatopsis sp.]|nr:glycosyltransferase family 9 protein [Amycolatopsis sp.]